MKRHLRVVAALLLPLSAVGAPPVRPVFERYGVEEGLPSSWITQIAQDRTGYLWLATADGLARYDGVEFTTVRGGRDGGGEIAGTAIESVLVDSADRLWVGSEGGGLAVLDADRRSLRRVAGSDPAHALFDADVWALGEDRTGAIWVGAYDSGLHRVDPVTLEALGTRHDPDDPTTPSSNHILSIVSDARGRVWVGTSAGLDLVEPGTSGKPVIARRMLAGEFISSLSLAPDGQLMVGGRGKMWRLRANLESVDTPERMQNPLLPPDAQIQGFVHDEAGATWILTRQNGALRIDGAGRTQVIAAQPGLPLALPTRQLLFGFRDRENSIWIGTYGSGLLQVRAGWRNFALLREDSIDARSSEPGSWVGAARCPDDDVWMLRARGPLLRRDAQSGRVTVERDESTGFAAWPVRTFNSLACDPDGLLWFGARSMVLRLDPRSGEMHAFAARPDYTPLDGYVGLLWIDRDGSVWAVTQGAGLAHFMKGERTPRIFAAQERGLRIAEVEQMGRAPDGSLWVAGDGGIDRLLSGAGAFVPVQGLPDGIVHAFDFASDGSVWLHSRDGLMQARVEGSILQPIRRFGVKEGLERMEVAAVVCDARDFVWLLGSRGIRRLDPRTGEWRQFGAGDGLGASELSPRPVETTKDGLVLALSTLGAVEFDPLAIDSNRVAPPLTIAGASVGRASGRLALPTQGGFTLRHDDRDLTFGARALSLVEPAANRYRYRLDPFDTGWHADDGRGVRTFSSLPSGDYRLRVQGANNNGVWSAPVTLGFVVERAPWRTPAALALYAFATALGIVFLILQQRWRWQRRHALALVEARRELAERANRAKSDFLADVAHEIRTPISGMSGMSDLLAHTSLDERQTRYVTRIRGAIDMLLKLINNLLDLARIESGHLELAPVPVDLCALLQEMVELESPPAQAKGIRLYLECDDSIPACVSVDPLRLRQILLNLIGNALKFIERGEVRLTASSLGAGWIRLCVVDTGPGLSAEAISRLFRRFSQADEAVSRQHGGSGLGLAIVSQLVELMQGRLTVESEPGRGSTFAVELPMPVARFDTTANVAQPLRRQLHFGEAPSPMTTSSDHAPTTPEAVAMRVLLVEDDAIVSEALGDLLERDGCDCVRAAHGLAALAELDRRTFDVALIDFDLPGLSGLELARMLRARGSRLPIIGISARADSRAEADALAAGMDLFLRKPIAAQLMRESLAAFVRMPL